MFYGGIVGIILAYLLGSFPSAYVIGKLKYGIDIRQHGSGNVGGANALRTMGIGAFAFVGVIDFGKGWLAVYVGKIVISNFLTQWEDPFVFPEGLWIGVFAFWVIIGHCYPLWLGFKGGKGWATTLGAMLGISPMAFTLVAIPWVLLVIISGMTSLANVVAVFLIPPALIVSTSNYQLFVTSLLYIPLIWWKHRENVERIIEGRERIIWKREPIKQ